jgi:hypothetical protein
MFYLGRATSTQTDLSPWADGPVYDVSTGLIVPNAATEVYSSSSAASYSFPVGIGQPQAAIIYQLPTITASANSNITITATVSCIANFTGANNTVFGNEDVLIDFGCYRTAGGIVAVQRSAVCAPSVAGYAKGTVTSQIQGVLVAGVSYQVYIVGFRNNWDGSKYLSCDFSEINVRAEIIKR